MKYTKRIGRLERKSKNTISIFRRIIDKMNLINERYNKLNEQLEDEILTLNLTKMSLMDSIEENKRVMEKFEKLVN